MLSHYAGRESHAHCVSSVSRSSRPEVFLGKRVLAIKYAANLQENTHAKVRFQ